MQFEGAQGLYLSHLEVVRIMAKSVTEHAHLYMTEPNWKKMDQQYGSLKMSTISIEEAVEKLTAHPASAWAAGFISMPNNGPQTGWIVPSHRNGMPGRLEQLKSARQQQNVKVLSANDKDAFEELAQLVQKAHSDFDTLIGNLKHWGK